jgi:glutamine amidotransferase PdxT
MTLNAVEPRRLTLWRVRKTVDDLGAETVQGKATWGSRAGLILIDRVAPNGDQQPLFLVAKGRPNKYHKQFGDNFAGGI